MRYSAIQVGMISLDLAISDWRLLCACLVQLLYANDDDDIAFFVVGASSIFPGSNFDESREIVANFPTKDWHTTTAINKRRTLDL